MPHLKTNELGNMFLSAVSFGLLCVTVPLFGQSARDGEWPTYGADLKSTKMSALRPDRCFELH